jgi:hypothetical protein
VTLLILLCVGVVLYIVALIMKFTSTKQVWSWFWLLPVLGASIFLFSLRIDVDDLKVLTSNIAAEVIGIAVTVFIIDRLIKRREEKQWLAAKQVIYARLLIIIEHPLKIMSRLIPGEYCKSSLNIYGYGFTSVASNMEFNDLSSLRTSILTCVKQDVERRASMKISAEQPPITQDNIYNMALLSTAIAQIHSILAGSNFLIEPVLTNLLLQFDFDCANLKRVTDIYDNSSVPHDEIGRLIYEAILIDALEKTIRTAVNVRKWLIDRADYHHGEEYFRQMASSNNAGLGC